MTRLCELCGYPTRSKVGVCQHTTKCKLECQHRERKAVRLNVLAHYSPFSPPRCACCDSTSNLSIDHIGGGGNAHRKALFGSQFGSHRFYAWLTSENFPSGFQVLCKPCNESKGDGDCCHLVHGGNMTLCISLPAELVVAVKAQLSRADISFICREALLGEQSRARRVDGEPGHLG